MDFSTLRTVPYGKPARAAGDHAQTAPIIFWARSGRSLTKFGQLFNIADMMSAFLCVKTCQSTATERTLLHSLAIEQHGKGMLKESLAFSFKIHDMDERMVCRTHGEVGVILVLQLYSRVAP